MAAAHPTTDLELAFWALVVVFVLVVRLFSSVAERTRWKSVDELAATDRKKETPK